MKNNFYISFIKRIFFVITIISLIFTSGCYKNTNAVKNENYEINITSSTTFTHDFVESEIEGHTENDTNSNIHSNANNADKKSTDNFDLVVDEFGTYTDKDHVALYLITYHKLPTNFITKKDAINMGWDSSQGNLWDVTDKKCIGGDIYKNYEKKLPIIYNRTYYECDIDYMGGFRNAKRLIYADDFDISVGCIYYTDDHYKSFTKIY